LRFFSNELKPQVQFTSGSWAASFSLHRRRSGLRTKVRASDPLIGFQIERGQILHAVSRPISAAQKGFFLDGDFLGVSSFRALPPAFLGVSVALPFFSFAFLLVVCAPFPSRNWDDDWVLLTYYCGHGCTDAQGKCFESGGGWLSRSLRIVRPWIHLIRAAEPDM
jgi:hypothetical protein